MLICPRCAKELSDSAIYCDQCGTNVRKFDSEPVSCPVCSRVYETGTRYCTHDGARLAGAGELVPTCPECGKCYGEDTKFCIRDGARLQMAPHSPSVFTGSYERNFAKATLGRRFAASLLDTLITTAMSIPSLILLWYGLVHIYRDGSGQLLALAGLLYLVPLTYSFIKDGLGNGQSFGKRIAGLMVVNVATNESCSKGRSCLRNFVSSVIIAVPYLFTIYSRSPIASLFLLCVALIEPIMVLAREDGRKLADLAAETQVVDVQFENYRV